MTWTIAIWGAFGRAFWVALCALGGGKLGNS